MKKSWRSPFTLMNTLKVQIAVYFLAASLILMVMMGTVLYYSISSIILNNSLKNTISSVEQSGNYIEVYIEKLKLVSKMIAENPETENYLRTQSKESRSNILTMINTALGTDSFLTSIILVTKDGHIVSNEKVLDMTISSDMTKQAWYQAASNSHQMPVLTSIRQQAFTMDKENWVISIGQEITDKNGINQGVLLIDIRYKVIENYLKNLSLGKNGYAFILNDANEVVYHPDRQFFNDASKRQSLIKINNMQDGYDAQMGMLTHHYKIPQTNWTLVGLSSLDDLVSIRRQIVETLVMVGIVLFGIVIGSGLFIAGRITNPIKDLEIAMQQVEEGLYTLKVDEKGCFEAKSLAQHFNVMTAEIQGLMEKISEKEQFLRKSEIESLYSQINPHFLYNTLDTIVWMAEFNDSEKVIAVTKALAQFFRLSLNQGNEMITLENEMEHVTQYLLIQQHRYGEQLRYDINLPTPLKHLLIPKIILQPIVENAIYHGLREADRPGFIEISAELERESDNENEAKTDSDILLLRISDNGVGFDPAVKAKESVKLGGVGLENVDKRIKLYYGETFGLAINSTLGKGTTVTIKLPYKGEK